jgi:hypothetical protein
MMACGQNGYEEISPSLWEVHVFPPDLSYNNNILVLSCTYDDGTGASWTKIKKTDLGIHLTTNNYFDDGCSYI